MLGWNTFYLLVFPLPDGFELGLQSQEQVAVSILVWPVRMALRKEQGSGRTRRAAENTSFEVRTKPLFAV